MTARAALQALVSGDPVLVGELGLEATYASNAVDTPGEDFFAVIKWEPTEVAFKTTGKDRVSVWFHDTQRDYDRITDALQRLKDIIEGAVQVAGADGYTLTLAEWNGESGDLFDAGYETVTRFADCTVISRYTPA